MRIEGKITTWKDEQGYGFITPDNGGPQVFVHIKAFLDGKARLSSPQSLVQSL